MFITSWSFDIRVNIQIWLLYRRYKSEWYNFWWATIQDIAACACKVWTLFGQACGQEECSQTTTTITTTTTTTTMTTDKSGLHRLATDILSWAKKHINVLFSIWQHKIWISLLLFTESFIICYKANKLIPIGITTVYLIKTLLSMQ